MSKLAKAFASSEKQEERAQSLFNNIFSSPVFRGFYEKETPEVDIKMTGSDLEQKRLTYLINTIAKNSPSGKKVLQEVANAGFTLGFERQRDSYGFCDPDNKVLMLNPTINDKKLMATLAHESRHVQQNIAGVKAKFGSYDVATELKLRRATEADAQATAAQVALEIRAATKDDKVWKALKQSDPYIANAVNLPPLNMSLDSVVKNQDVFMAQAFKGWFNDSFILRSYEEAYLYAPLSSISMATDARKRKIFAEKPFDEHLTSPQIVNLVCKTTSGKCYFENNQDVLDNYSAISKDTKEAADIFFKERKKLTGQPVDTSYQQLPEKGRLFYYSAMPTMPTLPFPCAGKLKSPALPATLVAALKNKRQH